MSPSHPDVISLSSNPLGGFQCTEKSRSHLLPLPSCSSHRLLWRWLLCQPPRLYLVNLLALPDITLSRKLNSAALAAGTTSKSNPAPVVCSSPAPPTSSSSTPTTAKSSATFPTHREFTASLSPMNSIRALQPTAAPPIPPSSISPLSKPPVTPRPTKILTPSSTIPFPSAFSPSMATPTPPRSSTPRPARLSARSLSAVALNLPPPTQRAKSSSTSKTKARSSNSTPKPLSWKTPGL